ncbi:hypothetical protein AK812_SmicGene42257 [Symbiodinium microadriaticum]|uniref:Uncharacterized protein n=1 Tax=Symbiodinium microadriaticum TaxID=2951 RepID=A0A1Q9C411_SYMMI|nr:hypothetical protein AK812_SmicGene42257 [Symbiodinium microadriaticum]
MDLEGPPADTATPAPKETPEKTLGSQGWGDSKGKGPSGWAGWGSKRQWEEDEAEKGEAAKLDKQTQAVIQSLVQLSLRHEAELGRIRSPANATYATLQMLSGNAVCKLIGTRVRPERLARQPVAKQLEENYLATSYCPWARRSRLSEPTGLGESSAVPVFEGPAGVSVRHEAFQVVG